MIDLSAEQKKMVSKGVRELMHQVKEGRARAMTDVESLINLALADDPAFLRIMRSLAEDADQRERAQLAKVS